MSTGQYIAKRTTRLAFGREARLQAEQGRSLRSIALGTGKSLQYVWRSIKAAELVDGNPGKRRTRTDPLLR